MSNENYIKKIIENDNTFYLNKSPKKLSKYSKNIENYFQSISNQLKKKSINGMDINAILYLIRTLLVSSYKGDKMSNYIQNWISSISKIEQQSAEGWIYIVNILHTSFQVVFKTPQKNNKYSRDTLLREFAIGYFAVNKLRYIIPTFMFTFNVFYCKKPEENGKLDIDNLCIKHNGIDSVYTIIEKIDGYSVTDMIKNNINFDDWLFIYLQILLTLEVSQKEINFTHFDLHTSNVLVQTTQKVSYDINIDNYTYSIKDSNIRPIIIDFGLSSCKINNKTIGSTEFPMYGMLNFMVQGYDMFKFLCFSAYYANYYSRPNLFNKIIDLFKFYDNDAPENISVEPVKIINTIIKTYCKEGSYTNIAKYTPLMMFNWINSKYHTKNIYINPRKTFINISYSNYLKEYNDFFDQTKEGIKESADLIIKCIENKTYILSKYYINIMIKLNTKLKSREVDSYITRFEKILKNNQIKNILINKDNNSLNNVFDISIPIQEELDKIILKILSINIRDNDNKKKHATIKELIILTEYEIELQSYLQLYYTIIELNLSKIYSNWFYAFIKSPIFEFYDKNRIKVEQARRWSTTLIESLNE